MKEFFNKNKQDYIIWRATDLFKDVDDDPRLKHEALKIIAKKLSYFDTLQTNIYLDDICKKIRGVSKKQLSEAMKEYSNEKNELRESAVPNNSLVDYEKWGFYVDEHCYFFRSKEEPLKMSNFEMRPIFHVLSVNDPRRIYELINYRGKKKVVDLDMQEMTSLQKFKQNVEGLGNFLWWGMDQHFTKLKQKLYEDQKTCIAIEYLGWQKEGFYAWSNGIIDNGEFKAIDDYGVVLHNNKNYFIPAFSKIYIEDTSIYLAERRFKYKRTEVSMHDWSALFVKVYGDNGKIGLCFWMATIFRDVFLNTFGNFPILNMYGPGGTGKSQLTASLMQLFGEAQTAANIHNTTKPGLAEHLQQFSNAFAWIDEYKNNIDTEKIEFLKSTYDAIGRNRMNIDKGKKKETTKVNAALILSGQDMPTADNALFLRVIFCQFYKNEFNEEESNRYDQLKAMMHDGMSQFTSEVVKHRKHFERNAIAIYNETYKKMNDATQGLGMKTRILHNWSVLLAAYETLKNQLNLALDEEEVQQVFIQMAMKQQQQVGKSNEMSQFWNIFMACVGTEDLTEGWDFRIDTLTELKTRKERMSWNVGKRILRLKFNDVYNKYAKESLRTGQNKLDASTMKAYLENSPVYIGEVQSVGFKKTEWRAGEEKIKRQTTSAVAFDYGKITDIYNIELSQTESSAKEEKAKEADEILDYTEAKKKDPDDDLPF